MKRSLGTLMLLAAGLTLGGCVDDYGGRYGGVYSAGAYPYGGGYYDGGYYGGYPVGGYYGGNGYYRGGAPVYRGGYPVGRPRVVRPGPRPNWGNGRPDNRPDRGEWSGRPRGWSGDAGQVRGNEPGRGGWSGGNRGGDGRGPGGDGRRGGGRR